MSASERRLETVSSNVSNVSTPGFKRQLNFVDLVAAQGATALDPTLQVRADLQQGRLGATGNPLDLALAGPGFFQLRIGEELVYSRQGQFRLAPDGTVVTAQGHVLQQSGGGDLVLERAAVEILEDGTVLDGGRPVARIGVFAAAEPGLIRPLAGSLFRLDDAAVEEVSAPRLRQGMVEASNVNMGDEMVAMMAAIRQAESGARLVQIYDDLLGRAITTFGQGGK